MPELPEVETVVRDLRPLAVGRTITAVRHGTKKLRKPWKPDWNPLVAGCRVEGMGRRGKWIVIELARRAGGRESPGGVTQSPPLASGQSRWQSVRGASSGGLTSPGSPEDAPRLIVHLGMSGRFTAVEAGEPAPDHLHLVFELDDGRELRFRDPRRFGSVTYYPDEAAVDAFFAQNGLGPEPFGLDPVYFRKAVRGTNRTLKAILLDQRVVAGVGNIYADEGCFLAGLHPRRRGRSLTLADADRLREAVEATLLKAIEHRGSTIRDYVGGSGERGGYQDNFRVYGRTGDPCPACATAIACVRLSGRASHFCPSCQRSSPQRVQRR